MVVVDTLVVVVTGFVVVVGFEMVVVVRVVVVVVVGLVVDLVDVVVVVEPRGALVVVFVVALGIAVGNVGITGFGVVLVVAVVVVLGGLNVVVDTRDVLFTITGSSVVVSNESVRISPEHLLRPSTNPDCKRDETHAPSMELHASMLANKGDTQPIHDSGNPIMETVIINADRHEKSDKQVKMRTATSPSATNLTGGIGTMSP